MINSFLLLHSLTNGRSSSLSEREEEEEENGLIHNHLSQLCVFWWGREGRKRRNE